MLGGNCAPCCGGWYCCPDGADMCAISPVVTITSGANRVRVKDSSGPANSSSGCGTVYARFISVTPVAHYAGAFPLTKGTGLQWSHVYPPDGAGCSASIVFSLTPIGYSGLSWAWNLALNYRWYGWIKAGTSPVTDSRSLSDMRCAPQVISQDTPSFNCYQNPWEAYYSGAPSVSANGSLSATCLPYPAINYTTTASLVLFTARFSTDGESNIFQSPPAVSPITDTIVEDSGSADININLTVSPR